MPSPSHSSRFYHPHNIGWAVQIICVLRDASPRNTPPPGDLSGGVVYLRIVLSPEQASHTWVFPNKDFLQGGVVSTSPNPQAGGPPLVGRPWLLIQFIRSYPPYRRLFLYPQPEDVPCRGDRDLWMTLICINILPFIYDSLYGMLYMCSTTVAPWRWLQFCSRNLWEHSNQLCSSLTINFCISDSCTQDVYSTVSHKMYIRQFHTRCISDSFVQDVYPTVSHKMYIRQLPLDVQSEIYEYQN